MHGIGHLRLTLIDWTRRGWHSLAQSLQPKETKTCREKSRNETEDPFEKLNLHFEQKEMPHKEWVRFETGGNFITTNIRTTITNLDKKLKKKVVEYDRDSRYQL